MIRHVVMWRVRGGSAREKQVARELVRDAFESLRGRIPGMTRLEIGLDTGASDDSCDVVLVSDFVSRGALVAYTVHPEHQRVRGELGDLCVGGHRVDYVVPEDLLP